MRSGLLCRSENHSPIHATNKGILSVDYFRHRSVLSFNINPVAVAPLSHQQSRIKGLTVDV